MLSDDPELLPDPDFFDELSFSGNLSPRGMISIPAGFFIFNVAASAEETGVIDTEGLISDPILEAVLLTTEDEPDCDFDEADEDDGDEVVVEFVEVPPDPDPEEGLDFKASEIENNKSISSRVPFEEIVTNLGYLIEKTKEISTFSGIIEAINSKN